MKNPLKYIAPALAAAGVAGALMLAPIASADTNPLVPYGTDPHSHYALGVHVSNHDEANQTAGSLDVPF
ncbi:hypothetical protein FZI85_00220 [Mycobacterium sp. CBMA293]|uniref:hypothetical protein n=1 Tax=unclassified Mycolicibacterium TaxID=2636767 RepID=UPI0012DF9885|nr:MULTISPECIES: hypothetical protein [unclassified Mycolicibacterium]MUL49365.1 hypothetical protein [Mycolicibacterium sp. CBMA 360]MUL57730.1 hypothetical protein [Mycolicibacterium sp. CBMA 335]MUL65474.1 hypothetical protein [Mycolicibacterium sp. CBMA 234]MUL72821.1 hypothetical protein [Mycolicibacterium sp. CBMA 311]MUL96771.1 hypothetical protein [Mycolicibacterium sp. CBMA 230]